MYNDPSQFQLGGIDPNFDPLYGTEEERQRIESLPSLGPRVPWYRRMLAGLANPVAQQSFYQPQGMQSPAYGGQLQSYAQLGGLAGMGLRRLLGGE